MSPTEIVTFLPLILVYIQWLQTHWLFLKGHKLCLCQWTIIIKTIINYIFLFCGIVEIYLNFRGL